MGQIRAFDLVQIGANGLVVVHRRYDQSISVHKRIAKGKIVSERRQYYTITNSNQPAIRLLFCISVIGM